MNSPNRRYDALWPTFNSAELKKIAVFWGASAKLLKADSLTYLIAAPNDPNKVDSVLTRMLPHERAALGLVKMLGDTTNIVALGIAVRATGMAPNTESYQREYGTDLLARRLLERGIVLQVVGSRSFDYSYSVNEKQVFADERVLARLPPPEYRPFLIEPADRPATSTLRRVPSVMLEVISFLRAVDDYGGIGLTQAGVPRANDTRKVARKLGWGEKIEIDGLTFAEPMKAYVGAMSGGGLLTRTQDALVNATSLDQIVRVPAPEIILRLMRGLLPLDDWLELDGGYSRWTYEKNVHASRFAVLAALRCLPERDAWFRFDDFERFLFERIGIFHSVVGLKSQPYLFRKSAEEERVALDAWRQEVGAAWKKNDVPWLQAAFRTWLYAFGLVELHLINGAVDRFRLTDLGCALLWEEPMQEPPQTAETQTSAWIVQPNFEIMVYLASASTEQIAFLEQYAERI